MPTYLEALHILQRQIEEDERKIRNYDQRVQELMRAAAGAKVTLEKAHASGLVSDAVVEAINLLRPVTPYTKDSGRTITVDPPLEK